MNEIQTNETNDNIITISEAEAAGISMKSVRICKEIRKLAQLDRIQLDMTDHRSGINKHLFSYIEYCQLDPRTYIREYLSNLQPYMIERFTEQEPDQNFICVLDHMYRISIYIKIDKTFGKEIIVSFHENNKRGLAKENNLIRNKGNRLVPIFAEEAYAKIEGSSRTEIRVLIQRGLLTIPIQLMGQKCENGTYIVYERDIEIPIVDQCNQYLRDLYTSDLDLEALDRVELFSVLHQISFTSYGNSIFSNITLLIDNLAIQKSTIGKKVADFALITYTRHILPDKQKKEELMDMLNEKYQVSSQRGIIEILERISDALSDETEENPEQYIAEDL